LQKHIGYDVDTKTPLFNLLPERFRTHSRFSFFTSKKSNMREGYSFTYSYAIRKARLFVLSMLIILGSADAFAQTLTTDNTDYPPLSNAVFTGDGFGANETVILRVKNLTQPCNTTYGDSSYLPWTVLADETGHFETSWTVCNCPGDSLKLKATGQSSGLYAEAFFTDGVPPPVSLATLGSAYTQNFNSLSLTGTLNTVTPDGWTFLEAGSSANTTYAAGTGSDNAGNTYSFGPASNVDRAFGGLLSGSVVPSVGASFVNNTGATITSLAISYTGEMWRAGVLNRNAADRLDFQLSTNATSLATASGTWVDYNSLDYNSSNINAAAGALDGNAAANRTVISFTITGLSIANGAAFWIRWTDSDITSSDDGLAVDDFSLTPNGAAPATAGIYESYAIMNFGGSDVYYDLLANTGLTDFNGAYLGTYNSTQALYLDGAQNKTYKCSPPSDVLNGKLYYRIYSTSETPGSFSSAVNLPFLSNDGATGCGGQNQTWQKADAGVNLLSGLCDGTYYIEVYTTADINTGTSVANNGGTNYKATFTVKNDDRSGIYQTMLVLKVNGGGDTYYDLQASTPAFDFSGSLGTFCPNGSLVVAGAEQKTFKCPNNDILNKNKLFYRVYPAGSPSGGFVPLDLGFISNDAGALCAGGQNQTWRNTGGTSDILTGLLPGNYTLEVYTQASYTTNGICESIHYSNNGGVNYKANFTVLAPPSFTTKPASSITFSTVSSCNAVGTYSFVTAGSTPISLSYTFSGVTTGSGSGTGTGATFNVGTTHVTVTASNACSPNAVYEFDVVVQDITPPTVVTQNVTVNLDASGNAIVTAAQVNNGSSDACGIASMSLSNISFNCSNVLPTASDLFISEYVEGSSNLKAIEIYNGTGAPVNLATYQLQFYFNGSATSGTTITLSGTLAANDVYVVADDNAGAGVLAVADQISTLSFFNGDDAIALVKSGNNIDVIGQIGVDPGTQWGSGLTSTLDHTLRRKSYVSIGDNNGSNAFNPATEWNGFALDNIADLGAHTYTGSNVVTLSVTDNNNNTGTATALVIVIDNLAPETPTIDDATGECTVTVTAPTTTDNCSVTVTGTTTDPLTYSTQGTSTIHWTFKDASGNTSTATQTVIVLNTTAPTPDLASLPDATGECSATIAVAPTATGNCGNTITGSTSDALTRTTQGTSVVTWTFTDPNGGTTATQTQNIVVANTTAPTPDLASLPDATGECSATIAVAPTATGNCGNTITGTTSDALTQTTQGTSVVTWTFTDPNGGTTATQTQNIVVANTTAPTPDLASLPDATGECSATIAVAPTATGNCGNTITGTTSDALTRTTQGTSVVTWTFTDPNGGTTATQTQNIVVDDVTKPVPDVTTLPVINATCSVTLSAPTATDNCVGNIAGTTPQLTFTVPGSYTVVWTYNDGNGNTETQSQTVNVAAVTVDANASSTPIPLGTNVILKATISPAVAGISIEFFVDGVSKGTATTNGSGYAELNIGSQPLEVYQVVAKALPSCGISEPAYLPVYDPNGSFVTGGGWIQSPAGAFAADPLATGKANFGFVSKYKKGSSAVDGNTEFQFHAGNLNFKSTLHEAGSLVITNGKATYRGDGTVNGVPGYKFTLIAIDGNWNSGTGPDKFRIIIKGAGGVVYDNQMGAAENADDATILGGGSIVIHQASGKKAAVNLYGTADKLEIKVSNNPSMGSQPFMLQFRSSDRSADISLKVLDANGKPVELKRGVRVGQTVEVGRSFVSGLYFVEAVQGDQRVVLKLIKQ
jgi:hypothetical protein